jgi:hypothetical protein
MTAQGAVLLWGTASVAGAITLPAASVSPYLPTDIERDSAASLTCASLFVGALATLEAGDGSSIKTTGIASELNDSIAATNGSAIQLGGRRASGGIVAVDAAASLDVGDTSGAALDAISIDANRPGRSLW